MVFFGKVHVFLSLDLSYLEQTEPSSPLKYLDAGSIPFKKVTQFSLGNNVLDAPASNSNGSLSRDSCVLSTYL
jgi:hypothetical protein